MPFFRYTAKNEHNETVKGKVEAKTKEIAASILMSRNLLVINVEPFEKSSFSFFKNISSGVKEDDIVNFTRQLSTMITAGLPLSTSLSILAEQGRPEIAVMVNEILRDVEGGKTFSQALEKKPKIFSRVYTQLIRAGEAGGVMDNILNRLADTLEKQKEFRGKTKGALIYPVIIVVAMVIVGFVMMIFVIPQLTEMYKDFGADLPFVTQMLIDISGFFVKYWWAMVAAIVGAIVIFQSWRKTPHGDRAFDNFLLTMPIFGELRQKTIITEFARTLSLLLNAGVSLINALQIVSGAMNSVNYRDALNEAAKKVEKGVPLSQALSVNKIFPPILHQMTSVGEETGKLDEILLKLSVYFETESEQAIKNLTTALEPAIMIVLGLGVGLMVVAIIMPIYSLTSQF